MLNDVMKDMTPLFNKNKRREGVDAKEVLTNDIGTCERNKKKKRMKNE